MIENRNNRQLKRRGVVVILVAICMVSLMAMVAFALDYGYLLKVRTDLQRTVDSAALASLQDLIPAPDGTQDLDAVRATIRAFATENTESGFVVRDADIQIGRFDPNSIYSNVTLLNTGVFDTVRVTVRRDVDANSPVPLFFAPVLGIADSGVVATATAVLQKATMLRPGDGVLPVAIPETVWDAHRTGEQWICYGEGKIEDIYGNDIPGNWGTVDIGGDANSTADISGQIVEGLRQHDLDELHNDGRIPDSVYIDAQAPETWLNADTGISVGLKHAVRAVHGQSRVVPIYDTFGGDPNNGNNLEFRIVRWGVVTVVDSSWQGAQNTWLQIEKSCVYDGYLRPQTDLGNTTGTVEGAFTSPVLVE